MEASYEIEYPTPSECRGDQNEEWVIVCSNGDKEKIRIHDYDRFYEIPGLYEEVVYNRLKCSSPQIVCGMLKEEIEKNRVEDEPLRTLDFGAGNGIVAEHLQEDVGCETIVGIDIIPQAKEAALRDRPGVYQDYYVLDMNDVDDKNRERLEQWNFNSLVTVAALGFDDIPTRAFLNAYNMMPEEAWIAFNIRDKFLSEDDNSGFYEVLSDMMGGSFEMLNKRHYRHRLSLAGDDLNYYAIVGRKMDEAPINF